MSTKRAIRWSDVGGGGQYVWVAAALLIMFLLLGAFAGVARAAADNDGIQRGIEADAARYQAMGAFYQAKAERGLEADAARYQAMGEHYLARAADDGFAAGPALSLRLVDAASLRGSYSGDDAYDPATGAHPELSVLLGVPAVSNRGSYSGDDLYDPAAGSYPEPAYTDVSRFYAERMRVKAREAGELVANPELTTARRSYRAATSMLAANPELMSARAWYAGTVQSIGSCSPAIDDDQLAANPELKYIHGAFGC